MVFAAGSFVTVMALTRSEDPTSSPINTSSTIYSPLPYIHCDEKRPDAEGKEKEKGEVVVVVDADQPDQMDEFKKHNIGMYENRIRNFSHPFKVFTYFASVRKGKQRFMTTRDFIRSILPYKPGMDHHQAGSSKRVPSAELFFSLADTDGDGLISFSEYMLFLTLLGTPEYHWKISFKLFDLNGDGTVSKDEFQKIINRHTADLAIGQRMGNQEVSKSVQMTDTGINRLFFGKRGEKALKFEEFSDFMRRLHLEVLKLEFYQYNVDKKDETISLKNFAHSIINFVPPTRMKKYSQIVSDLPEYEERLAFGQFYEFNHMIRTRIHDVGLAYRFYQQMNMHDQGQPDGFTRDEFQQITKAVTKLSLTPGQVDVLFNLFDKNHDGRLDADEFYGVLRNRGDKGLNNPKDLGVTAFFKRVVECIRDSD